MGRRGIISKEERGFHAQSSESAKTLQKHYSGKNIMSEQRWKETMIHESLVPGNGDAHDKRSLVRCVATSRQSSLTTKFAAGAAQVPMFLEPGRHDITSSGIVQPRPAFK